MFLGLDLGTTNVKVVVVDLQGRVVADDSVSVDRYHTPDGGVEQDIYEIWDAACEAIRSAAATVDPTLIEAIGVSSQGGALQLLDTQDKPIARVISWLDGRGRPFNRRIVDELGEDYLVEHTGANTSAMALGQLVRLREQVPELLAASKHLGFVGDVIVGRLTGHRAHDPTSLSIGMLYNPSLRRADPKLLDRLTIREEQLPALMPAVSPAGGLSRQAAELTGLLPGIPVSPAVHDQYAASVGAGSVHPGDVCLGTGTAWVLLANTAGMTPPVAENTFVCPHPVEGLFGQLLSMGNGGSALEWALKLSGQTDPASRQLDRLLEAVPAGSEGLRFWPLLLPAPEAKKGVRNRFPQRSAGCPEKGARNRQKNSSAPFFRPGGRLEGITLAHSANHLLRSVVEGLACELARHLGFFSQAGLPVRRLVMCGAAAASRVTPQIVADVTNQPVTCIDEPAVSAFGAAVIGRALRQDAADLGQLAKQFAPPARTITPGENAAQYRRLLDDYLARLELHSS